MAARDNLAEKNGLELEYPDKVFNVPFQRLPFDRRNIGAYKEIKRILAENHYDVIHCNTPVGGIVARLAGRKYRKFGTQVFYTAHGFHFYHGAPKQNWIIYYSIEKWMSRYTDKLITITTEDFELAKKKFHCPVYHIHGVGVDEHRYHPVSEEEKAKLRQQMGYAPDQEIILCVGELLPNKNQSMAIHMMKELVLEYPSSLLLIAGNGPEKKRLEDEITSLNLQDNIRLIGYVTNLQDYQHVADVSISCSHREGMPLNIIEAMLSKTPVVATHNRGHNELIDSGVTGFLVKDEHEMKARVVEIIGEPDIAETAYKRIQSYSATTVTKELKGIYEI